MIGQAHRTPRRSSRGVWALALAVLAGGIWYTVPALAERIAIETPSRTSAVARPHRGMTMADVEARFGPPSQRHPPVGDPPITRWVYPAYVVFFEHDRVIHSVVKR